MSLIKQTNSLFKAVKAGFLPRVRELLAAGVPLEATDPDKKTPVMVAAEAGQLETFHALVELGANLQAIGLCTTDLLECAAEGGNLAIVQYVLDQGHPVDGHWKPRSKVDQRMGHMTPLYLAAINGHVEVVLLLLAAGANPDAKFDNETALKMIQRNIKHPFGEDELARVPRLKEVAALMKNAAPVAAPEPSLNSEVDKFSANANRPAYQSLLQSLTAKCGPPKKWKQQPDHGVPAPHVVRFKRAKCKQQDLDALQQEARAAGCQLVLDDLWLPGRTADLVLIPSDSPFDVVTTIGTAGENESVDTEHIVAWLQQMATDNPFHLTFCSYDFLGGTFIGQVKNAKKLANRMVEICSSCLDELDSPDELAKLLKQENSFFLRWD